MSLLLQQILTRHIKMGLIISIYYLSNLSKQGIVVFFLQRKGRPIIFLKRTYCMALYYKNCSLVQIPTDSPLVFLVRR